MRLVRILLAMGIMLTGLAFAFRTLYRPSPAVPEPDRSLAERPERVGAIAKMDKLGSRLRAPSRAEVPHTLAQARDAVRSRARALPSASRFSEEQTRDLGTAFSARLAYLLGGDFDENVRELASRGWPMPSAEGLAQKREIWEQYVAGQAPPPLSVEDIEVRRVTGDMLDEPGGLMRPGFGLSTLTYGSQGSGDYFGYEGQELVEVVMPMRTEDVQGRPTESLVGFMFAWDDRDGAWRPIRSVLLNADDEAGGIATPDIF